MATGTALTAASIGVTLAGSGMSFAQAAKQKRLQEQAQAEASKAFDTAKGLLDVNYYDKIALNNEAYRAEREAMLAAGAQQVEAAREDPYGRGLAAVAGRIQMAQTQGQQQITQQQSKDLLALQEASAKESSRLAGEKADLYKAEAEGAQKAAQDAQAAAAASTQAGMQGIASAIGQGVTALPLFTKNASVRAFEDLNKAYSSSAAAGTLPSQFLDESGKPLPFQQALGKIDGTQYGMSFSGINTMDPIKFQDYMTQQKANNLKQITSQFTVPEQQRTNTTGNYFSDWLNAIGQGNNVSTTK